MTDGTFQSHNAEAGTARENDAQELLRLRQMEAQYRQTEAALRASERRLTHILESIGDAFTAIDRDGRITYMNAHALALTGKTREETLGRSASEVFPVFLGTPLDMAVRRALAEGASAHFEYLGPYSGRWFETSIHPSAEGVSIYSRDIHDRKIAAEALRREQEFLQRLIDTVPVMLAIYRPDTQVLQLNRELEQKIGWTAEEAQTIDLMEQCYPDPAYREKVRRFMLSLQEGWMDIEMVTKSGQTLQTLWANMRLSDETQVGIGIDITERKRIEEALRESEQRLRIMADTAPAYISHVDAQGRFLFMNRRNAERFGLQPEDLVGKHVREVMGEEAYQAIAPYMERVLAGETFSYEITLPYARIGTRHMEAFYAPEFGDDGTVRGFVAIILDVTERKRMEEERARHVAEIERLNQRLQQAMRETHHRVKNNLQLMAAMIDLQTLEHPDVLPTSAFDRLSQQVRTLAAVHDILTEQARADGSAERVSARTVLDKLFTMLRTTAGRHRLRFTLEDMSLSSRQATALALIANELTANALKYGRKEVGITFAIQRETAVLTVEDDGPGFPPDFDPAQAARTGLELVLNVIGWDMQGRAEFRNREGGGGGVTVTFPLTQETFSAEEPLAL